MAGETASGISTALSQIYTAKLADQRNMDAVELDLIPIVPGDSGKNVAWGAKFSGTKQASAFPDGGDVQSSEYTKTAKVPAVLGWAQYRCPAEVTDLAVIEAALADGSPDELRALADGEILDSLMELTKLVATDIHTGDGTDANSYPTIVGIHGGAALNSGTYASIDRSTYPEWKGNVLANGGVDRPLTDDLIRQGEVAVFNAGGMPPNLAITTANIHRKYAGLFQSIQRVITPGQAPTSYGMGTNDLYWGGAPVVRSVRAPAKKLVLLHTSNVQLVFPRALMPVASVPLNPMVQRMGLDLKRQYMLPIVVEQLARVGNALRFNVWTYVQLRVRNPNAVAIIDDISES